MATINCFGKESELKIEIAENSLLSYINKNGIDAIKTFCPKLDKTYFSKENNIRLFDAFVELTKRNVAFDAMSISVQDPKAAPAYITLVDSDHLDAEEVKMYFDLINSRKRVVELYNKIESIKSILGSWEVGEHQDYINSALTSLNISSEEESLEKERFSEGAIAEWEANFKKLLSSEKIPCTSTGIKPIDEALSGGLYDGDLYTIAARTSVGKTALAVNLFVNIGLQNVDAVYYSNEMTRDRLIDRCNSMLSLVEYRKMKNPKCLTVDEKIRIFDAKEKLRKLPLSIKVVRDCNWFTIENDIRKNFRLYKSKVVFIDYIQQYKSGKKSAREDIEYMTGRAKQLAIELNMAIVMVAQMNRLFEREQSSREPQLSDLKDCGSIEQDSDAVLMMFVEKQNTEDEIRDHADRKLRGVFAKNRNGALGRIDFLFTPQFNKFSGSLKEHEIYQNKVERIVYE
jgi:replicative DNA helicase